MGSIYWIASYPKSGNTWMRAFLAKLIGEDEEARSINRMHEIIPDEYAARYYQPFLTRPLAEAPIEAIAAVRPRVHRRLAGAADGFLFLKVHSLYGKHLGTPTILPEVTAGAIYLVRNPLDVVVSYSRFRDWTIDETIAVLNEPGRILPNTPTMAYVLTGAWSEHVQSWTRRAHDRLMVVRYEDMLENPADVFGSVARFLRMRIEPRQLERAIEQSSFEALRGEELESGFVERPASTSAFFRRGKPNQWREALNERQIAAIVEKNADAMRRFGYLSADDQLL
jgi:hypothetical protein